MKLGLLCSYSKGATVNRIVSMINVMKDHEVHLIGACDQSLMSSVLLENKNITIHHVKEPKPSENFILRYVQEFSFGIKCAKRAKGLKLDVLIVSVPFIAMIVTSRLFGGKSRQILDIRDLQWEYLGESSMPKRLIKTMLKRVHLFFASRYHHITLSNPKEKEILMADLKEETMTVVSNGVSQFSFNTIRSSIEQTQVSVRERQRITYIGNVGIAQNISTFIDVISELPEFELVVVGDGADLQNLKQKIADRKIENVKLIGRVSPTEVIQYYASTDFLWAKLDAEYLTAVPSKLYEYLATGNPIIYSGSGAAVELLSRFENVHLVEDNSEAIRSFLKGLRGKNRLKTSDHNIALIQSDYIRENINTTLLKIIASL